MNKKKTVFENDFNITEEQMDSLARVIFPLVYNYLTSEKGAENDMNNSDDTSKCAYPFFIPNTHQQSFST